MERTFDEPLNKYNQNSENVMNVNHLFEDWFALFINNLVITEGDEEAITERIKQINRENGYNW